jgi:hypothetical protein
MSENTLSLGKSLVKKVRFSGTQTKDIGAYYKAFKEGSFDILDLAVAELRDNPKVGVQEFEILYSNYVNKNNLLSVSFFVYDKEKNEERLVGCCLFWPRGRVLQVSNMIWFPWASKREVYESSMNFFETFRKTIETVSGRYYKILEFAEEKDSKFFDRLVSIGILERKCEIDGLYPDGNAILYVTKEIE